VPVDLYAMHCCMIVFVPPSMTYDVWDVCMLYGYTSEEHGSKKYVYNCCQVVLCNSVFS
jgi:hypothetical protein